MDRKGLSLREVFDSVAQRMLADFDVSGGFLGLRLGGGAELR